ncbi:MarR family transcriptional regulator [Erythrobacter sp. A6_0]|uniref:MarR family winged helix-turn-helix transcriptional regulator n=1 Tax=Erythrobacter sp. A6_0 TaxID=2821089 RepID=UPI001ADD1944|nr:MarR family transcriptional regulator [Erythrobacter sp. A6_0]MBO9512378.1 MarR family transcriptional regulator [Erythrobacter sp. A6_0]
MDQPARTHMDDEHLQVARLTRGLASHLLERATITARHHGLGVTEVRAMEQLYLTGPMTAGELGTSLALTSGSVTALVGRLLKNKLVVRTRDEDDRRKVWITIAPDKADEFIAPYLDTIKGGSRVVKGFSKEDRQTAVRFLEAYYQASAIGTEDLRKTMR